MSVDFCSFCFYFVFFLVLHIGVEVLVVARGPFELLLFALGLPDSGHFLFEVEMLVPVETVLSQSGHQLVNFVVCRVVLKKRTRRVIQYFSLIINVILFGIRKNSLIKV